MRRRVLKSQLYTSFPSEENYFNLQRRKETTSEPIITSLQSLYVNPSEVPPIAFHGGVSRESTAKTFFSKKGQNWFRQFTR